MVFSAEVTSDIVTIDHLQTADAPHGPWPPRRHFLWHSEVWRQLQQAPWQVSWKTPPLGPVWTALAMTLKHGNEQWAINQQGNEGGRRRKKEVRRWRRKKLDEEDTSRWDPATPVSPGLVYGHQRTLGSQRSVTLVQRLLDSAEREIGRQELTFSENEEREKKAKRWGKQREWLEQEMVKNTL